MTSSCILSLLIGGLLGLRLKVFVLVPVTLLAAVSVAVIGTVSGWPAASVLLAIVAVACSLQFGYVAGTLYYAGADRRSRPGKIPAAPGVAR